MEEVICNKYDADVPVVQEVCIEKNTSNSTIESDIENPEYSDSTKETCVICLNIVDEDDSEFKFECRHKKYMHHKCIEKISKCPLCRVKSLKLVEFTGMPYEVRVHGGNNNFAWATLTGILLLIILLSIIFIQPILFIKSSNSYFNETSYNDTNYNNNNTLLWMQIHI